MAKITNKNVADLTQSIKDLKDTISLMQEIRDTTGDFNNILKDAERSLKSVAKTTEKVNATFRSLNASELDLKQINKDILKNKIEQQRINDRMNSLNAIERQQAENDARDVESHTNKIKEAQKELLKMKYSGQNISEQDIKDKQKEIYNLQGQLLLLEDTIDVKSAEFIVYKKILEALQETAVVYEQMQVKAKDFNKKLGITGVLLKKMGVDVSFASDAFEAMSKAIEKGNGKLKVFFKGLYAGVKEALQDPMVQFTLVLKAQTAVWNGIKKAFSFIVDIAKKAYTLLTGWNTQIFEFAKNLGIGEKAARGLQNSFLDMANTSGDLYFNTKELREAYTALTEATGLFLENNRETTETAAILQRQFGLTSQHLGSIAENSAISGKSFKDTYYTINSIRIIEGSRNKTLMSQRQMMDEISKLSSVVLINFKGNVPALAAAVVKAKALGMDLNTIVETSKGFLDFESSISKEFEAQLFTGKDLNLQRLRYLSMTNDTAGLMAEIGKRIPSIVAYEKMNAYERETYAEALNMSSEALADIIKKQELNRKYGIAENATAGDTYNQLVKQGYKYNEIADILGEQAVDQDRSASIADRWNSVVDNIKDTLGQMLEGEIGGIIKRFQDLVKSSGGIQGIMEKIRSIAKGVASFFANIPEAIDKIVKKAANILHFIAGAQAVIGGFMLLSPITAPAGAGLLIGAAKTEALALALTAGNSVAQDFMKPTTVSGAAAAAQVSSNRVASTSSNSNSSNSASTVAFTLNTVNSYDGQRSAPVVKKYFFGPSGDNVTGEFGKEHNISIGGS